MERNAYEEAYSHDKRRRSSKFEGDENEERGNWSGKLDFVMSLVSYAVGLGNIWRFPYLCYRNGGVIFLIPYVIFLILCGMPLFFIEATYGQFASLSPITVWRMSPLFKGIGYGMVIISGIVCIYYNVIIAWTIYYLVCSFFPTLPWKTCDNEWNTDACVSDQRNDSVRATFNVTRRTSSSEEFWERRVLHISDSIDNMGSMRWDLCGCLALSWIIIFVCLIKGIKSSGVVARFTATFPYLGLLVLLIRGVTLPGAIDGILYYVTPQWDKLFTLQLWSEAAMQMFYSVGATWGAICTLASYNKFHHNCYRDSIMVPTLEFCTSIFAGFAIFAVLGFMAHETQQDVSAVVTQGPGLVFVVYPEALGRMPFPQLWSILFFTMLLSVGVGSQMGMFQTMTSAFSDEFAWFKNRSVLLCALLCLIEFCLGLPCVFEGGVYYLQIMDWYSSAFSLMILSIAECLVISWIYGIDRFYKDLALMLGRTPSVWWKICWCYITPAVVMVVLMFSIVQHTPVTYGDYVYPGWAVGVGWLFAICSMVPLPVLALVRILKAKGSLHKRIASQVKPTAEWGPAVDEYRELYQASLATQNHTTQLQPITTSSPSTRPV